MIETNWNDLARRCEEATGPDRELDCAIDVAAFGGETVWKTANYTMEPYPVSRRPSKSHVGGFANEHVPIYTASLDAITALIERELPGHAWSIVHRLTTTSIRPNGQIWTREERSTKHGDAATPALALCAAFCRATAHRSTPHE